MTEGMVDKGFKEFLSTLDADVRFDEPMKGHTYLAIGGPADVFITPRSVASLSSVLKAAKETGMPVFPVGGGTNILVSDMGIEGAAVSMAAFNEVRTLIEDSDSASLYVDAGFPLMRFLRHAAEKGLAGIEGLAGIPGQVGGAVAGNAGAFDCEIKDVIINVSLIDSKGNIRKLPKDEINFAYRYAGIPRGEIILGAEFSLAKDDPGAVSKRMQEFMDEKKSRQPLGERSAGCVYKNPEGGFAGKLIEDAGCRGMRVGGVEVSTVHANFFINTGGGTATDYMSLMLEVVSKVRAASGVMLEPEVRVVGRC